jgi:type IV pilus assembly protein PilV
MKTPAYSSQRSAAGFTLIEAMVAVVVLSIGMLGIAALIATLIQRNNTSIYGTVAAAAANDIMEKIRANPTGYSNGTYFTYLSTFGAAPAALPACDTSSCTPDNVAAYDAVKWEQSLGQALPSGKGIVCFDNSPNDGDSTLSSTGCDSAASGARVSIKIFWDETRSNGRATNSSVKGQRYATTFFH